MLQILHSTRVYCVHETEDTKLQPSEGFSIFHDYIMTPYLPDATLERSFML
jgi:hypothetical protein